MVSPSTPPKTCNNPNCRGLHEPVERMAMAASICESRGAQFTKVRRQILGLLWDSGRPTGAYELIEALKENETRQVAPTTVYRALEFLISEGLVSKIESRNAYVPCAHPERQRSSMFFICNGCGASAELEDEPLERVISEVAAQIGFHTSRRVIEVEGTCTRCNEAGEA